MKFSLDRCRIIAAHYQTHKRSISTIANELKTSERAIRRALRIAGVKVTDKKPQGYKCKGCGLLYTHQFCALCRLGDCIPVLKLRLRKTDGDAAIREYNPSRSSRLTAWV